MKAPYASTNAALGGLPTVGVDVPILAVFLFLFICGAVSNMTLLQVNRKRGHKFLMSGMLFGFCMARITACMMRIVWACRPKNLRIAIASSVFTAAGVLLLFIANLLFAQRIFRAQHPNAGWSKAFHFTFIAIYAVIPLSLVMLIVAVVQSFYTLNGNTRRIDRDIQLYGQTYFVFVSFLPIVITTLSLLLPRKAPTEKFGTGRFRNKIYIVYFVSFLCCLGAAYRMGTAYKKPVPNSQHPAYFGKAPFYVFNFTIEIIIIASYILLRVDRRFWVPNASHGPGDYSREKVGWTAFSRRKSLEESPESDDDDSGSSIHGHVIAPEEAIFDNETSEEAAAEKAEHQKTTAAEPAKTSTNV